MRIPHKIVNHQTPSNMASICSQNELVRLTPSMIPDACNFDAKDSSFFNRWSELPSPEEVRKTTEDHSLDNRKNLTYAGRHMKPPLAVFDHMGLVVKWGVLVNIHEAQSTYAVYHLLNGRVPVPEIFGWRTDGGEKFIYMQYVQGQTLEKAWDSLQLTDRDTIARELRTICDNLRQLEQDHSDKFIGNVMRKSIYDRVFASHTHEAGPFTTVREFHDWFIFLCRKPMRDPHSVPIEPFRYDLPDDNAIKFTQGDLHRSNIIISLCEPCRVLAIVDWEQSGWLPEYWEARKMEWTVSDKEWPKYPPLILDQYKSTVEAWWWYVASLGC
ncbi:hypothetical protein ACN38_g1999 [Penicillium nordicum]|uniref:Aminoglycoside phosphotransferase domain-containing protein n=1 Tax=Penicillium nordicum TaxID=229535 RepID=A0A0M8PEK2_9EURO|nr:hypothetical protein ACN38_g1999 [Penicillium nordicum]